MKKIIITLLSIITIFILMNSKSYGYVSNNFSSGTSDYWNSSSSIGGYTHIGNTTITGTWWDGLVQNKTWTYIDYQIENSFTATYETLLTSPTIKPDFVSEMYIGYKYTQTFIKQSKTSIYGYLELQDGYQIDHDLYSIYSTNITTQGTEIEIPVMLHPDGNSYPSSYEYAIGLYRIQMNLRQTKVYRYEIGSWWSKSIVQETENKLELVTVAYVAIAVRVDQSFNNSTYFYNNSGIDRIVIK